MGLKMLFRFVFSISVFGFFNIVLLLNYGGVFDDYDSYQAIIYYDEIWVVQPLFSILTRPLSLFDYDLSRWIMGFVLAAAIFFHLLSKSNKCYFLSGVIFLYYFESLSSVHLRTGLAVSLCIVVFHSRLFSSSFSIAISSLVHYSMMLLLPLRAFLLKNHKSTFLFLCQVLLFFVWYVHYNNDIYERYLDFVPHLSSDIFYMLVPALLVIFVFYRMSPLLALFLILLGLKVYLPQELGGRLTSTIMILFAVLAPKIRVVHK
jgi:hypothetical protein